VLSSGVRKKNRRFPSDPPRRYVVADEHRRS
jgi:hypothetical protein